MTPDRLDQIRWDYRVRAGGGDASPLQFELTIRELLAEVDQLNARVAELEEDIEHDRLFMARFGEAEAERFRSVGAKNIELRQLLRDIAKAYGPEDGMTADLAAAIERGIRE